ncbi:hypothetical protein D1BOALGB6SA_7286 [Olavius sp. associated proteobacterium Delta 1]|nr:hypothetical protein D1BOALGB6SA_7286 [Olavius sp. associated proteobacterium Delta 1]
MADCGFHNRPFHLGYNLDISSLLGGYLLFFIEVNAIFRLKK